MKIAWNGNLFYKNKMYTKENILSSINIFCVNLSKISYNKDEVVGLIMKRDVDMVITIFSLLELGIPFLPLDYEMPKSRIDYMINQAGVNKIICNFDIEDSNDRMYINVNDFKKELFDADRHVIQKVSNIAYILFTSGSTGKPKGVIVEREALGLLIFLRGFFMKLRQEKRDYQRQL